METLSFRQTELNTIAHSMLNNQELVFVIQDGLEQTAVLGNVNQVLIQWEEKDPSMDVNALDVVNVMLVLAFATLDSLEPNVKINVLMQKNKSFSQNSL
jgi:ethanolamine ammonia-lyase small subunit